MVSQLNVFPLANGAAPRRCSCGCLASHAVVAQGPLVGTDSAMFVCDRDADLLLNGAPRLRSVA